MPKLMEMSYVCKTFNYDLKKPKAKSIMNLTVRGGTSFLKVL